MLNDIESFLNSVIQASKQAQKAWPYADKGEVDTGNDLECIKLYKEGWRHDGFEYVPNTSHIIVYWTNGIERKPIKLTLVQQIRWMARIKELKK